ncbi:TDRD1_4_6_7 [Acanthosepion pharaonis]|uniref:TDRD1_4_6_7 n=1 Tax=Acanthosepion pharaonis TaxID=158019 RepID=A0A812C334_ACAPH|nr:TDRD1_4_6_7 [Sepia pharaonis]
MDFSPQAFHCSLSTSDNEFVTEGWTGYLKVDAITEDGHYLVSLNQDTISASLPMYLQPEYVAGFTVEVIVCFTTDPTCLAKCSGDAEVWQRGIIQEEENGAIKIFFVDTGKEEKIPKSSVHRCPLSLFNQPVLAVSCFLVDIQPLNGSWSSAASELFKELTHNVSLELKAEVRSGGQHGIYLYKEDDDEAINDRFVDLGYALAESGSKLEVNRELEHSLLDPHRTKHMELSFHDISCCRESCYDDDFDCDTLSHNNSHGHILIEDSIKGPAVITNATRLKQEVTDENDKILLKEESIETSQKKSEEHCENLQKTGG